jgi:hypothetical protein
MAAIRFSMAVTESGQLKPPVLTQAQLNDIGNRMVLNQKNRWSRGIDADDQAAPPLKPKTAKIKKKYKGQGRPIRDMNMTGLTRNNFTLRKATMQMIRAENTSGEGRRRARTAQRFANMIGLAPSEEKSIAIHLYAAYGIYLQRAWKKTT